MRGFGFLLLFQGRVDKAWRMSQLLNVFLLVLVKHEDRVKNVQSLEVLRLLHRKNQGCWLCAWKRGLVPQEAGRKSPRRLRGVGWCAPGLRVLAIPQARCCSPAGSGTVRALPGVGWGVAGTGGGGRDLGCQQSCLNGGCW